MGSGCTKNLADLIELQLQERINFLRISEGIANSNMNEFCKRINLYKSVVFTKDNDGTHKKEVAISDFYKNPLFSFPSNDFITNIFLEI